MTIASRMRRLALTAVFGLLVALLPCSVMAEPTREQVDAADQAFAEGKRFAKAGHYDKACAAFEKSLGLAAASGTLLNLGDCYERQGKTATAWATFRASAALARNKKSSARASEALARAAALETRLAKLRVVVPDDVRVPKLTIQRDDVQLEATLWDDAVPVDPGPHRVRVEAPGYAAFERELTVPATAGVVELIVPPLTANERADAPRTSSGDGEVQRIFGFVLGSVGLVAIGVGLGVGVDAIVKNGRAEDEGCRDDLCPPQAHALRSEALTHAHVSTGLTVAGLVHVGAAVVLLLTAPSGELSDEATLEPLLDARLDAREEAMVFGLRGRW
jgi:hypothetical protein